MLIPFLTTSGQRIAIESRFVTSVAKSDKGAIVWCHEDAPWHVAKDFQEVVSQINSANQGSA